MPPTVTLPDHPHLWRRGAPRTVERGLATGHATLDAVLPGGGLPGQALTEILLPDPGHGEWTLLLPLLARMERSIALVAPPLLPYPPALLRHGIDVQRLLLVATRDQRETLWAAEQCLRSGACDAVLAWLVARPASGLRRARSTDTLSPAQFLRRLQLACEAGRAPGIVFRDPACAAQASPAALRLKLHAGEAEVLKCRGGNPGARVTLNDPGLEA